MWLVIDYFHMIISRINIYQFTAKKKMKENWIANMSKEWWIVKKNRTMVVFVPDQMKNVMGGGYLAYCGS
jgi:uncharacterized protein YxjI